MRQQILRFSFSAFSRRWLTIVVFNVVLYTLVMLGLGESLIAAASAAVVASILIHAFWPAAEGPPPSPLKDETPSAERVVPRDPWL